MLWTVRAKGLRNEAGPTKGCRRTFRDTTQEVLVVELRRALPQRDHAGLDTDRLQLRAVELIRAASELLVVDIRGDGHLSGVDLQDTCPRRLVRKGELDLPV